MPIQAPQWTEFLSCPICCNVFNEKLHRPISLGCGHTVCKLCLAQLQQKKCPFDQTTIGRKINELPVNFALLQLVGVAASERAESREMANSLVKENSLSYDVAKHCIEQMAIYLKPISPSSGVRPCPSDPALTSPNSLLSRPMQRKLVALVNCQLIEEEGRSRALRAARSLGERTVTELILQHQNPQQLSANLWAAVRTRGCQFLGPAMQEEVLKLILLALEDGSALSRKVLVLFVVQRLEAQYPQASKTAIGHVVQLLYRASCFKVTKREKESSLMQLKEEFCEYESLRREHDSQIVQIATEAGLRISPEQWSSLLYGDIAHKSHMQSIIDKLQTPQSFTQSVDELAIVLQRTSDPYGIAKLRPHFDLLANVDPNQEATVPSWEVLAEVMQAVQVTLDGLVQFIQKRSHRSTETLIPQNPKFKTSMCRDLLHKGRCPRADNCTFAHSQEELERYRANSRRMGKAWTDSADTGGSGWKGQDIEIKLPDSVHMVEEEHLGNRQLTQHVHSKRGMGSALTNATYGSDTLSTLTPPSYSSPVSQFGIPLPSSHGRNIATQALYQHLAENVSSSAEFATTPSVMSSTMKGSNHRSSSTILSSSCGSQSSRMATTGLYGSQLPSNMPSSSYKNLAIKTTSDIHSSWPESAVLGGFYDSPSVRRSSTEVTYSNRSGPLSSGDSGYEAYLANSCVSPVVSSSSSPSINLGFNTSARSSYLSSLPEALDLLESRSSYRSSVGVSVPVAKPYILPATSKTSISKQLIYSSPTPSADERKALQEPIAHSKASTTKLKQGPAFSPSSFSSAPFTSNHRQSVPFIQAAIGGDGSDDGSGDVCDSTDGGGGDVVDGYNPMSGCMQNLTESGKDSPKTPDEMLDESVKMLPNPSSVMSDKYKIPTPDSHYYLSSNFHLATRGMFAKQQVGELQQRRKELLVQLSQTRDAKKEHPKETPKSAYLASHYDPERLLVNPTDNHMAENFKAQLEYIMRRQNCGPDSCINAKPVAFESCYDAGVSVAANSGRFDDVVDMRGFYELQMSSQSQEPEVSRWDDTGDEFVPLEHTFIPKFGPISRIIRTKLKNTSPVQVTAALERKAVTAVTAVTPVYRPYPLAKQVPSQFVTFSMENHPTSGVHFVASDHVADPNGAHVATSLPTALIQPNVMVAGKPSEPSMLWVLKEQMMSVKGNDPIKIASLEQMQQEISQLNIQIENLKLSEDVRMIRELQAIELSIQEKERHIKIVSG